MPTLNFTIKYGKNQGLVVNPWELINQYLFGLEICSRDGKYLENDVIVQKILSAQRKLETFLMIKLQRQVISEQRDFMRGDYYNWGFLTTNYPVKDVLGLEGFISTTKQVTFPIEWVSNAKSNQEDALFRTLHVVPAGSTTPVTNSAVFVGIAPNLGYLGVYNIPNYWSVKYVTGFLTTPAELLEVVGKMAAIEILAIIGDLVLHPGVTSQSLSYDGLSESVSTAKSGQTSAYSARIKQYSDDLTKQLPQLKDYYKGMIFTTM